MDQTSTHKKWQTLEKKKKNPLRLLSKEMAFKMVYKKLELNAWLVIYHSGTEKKNGFWENQDWSYGMVSLYNYTIFSSNRFRNSMQTYFALGLIQTHANLHTYTCMHAHTQLVKLFSKWRLWKKRVSGGFEKIWSKKFGWGGSGSWTSMVCPAFLRCVLPSLPWVGGWTSMVCPAFSPTGWWLNFYAVSYLLSHGLVVELLWCVQPSLPRVGGWTSMVCPAFSPTGWWLNFYGVSCLLSHGLVVELLWCVLPSLPRVGGWTSKVCLACPVTTKTS